MAMTVDAKAFRTKALHARTLLTLASVATAALTLVAPGAGAAGTANPPAATCTSAAPHDTNGDGYSDTAVGSPHATMHGQDRAGAVTVFDGSADGLVKTATLEQGKDGVPSTLKQNHGFGVSLIYADVNGDGCSDLIISSSQGTTYPSAATTVLFGSPDGITTTGAQFEGTTEPLAAGDFNGDGYADLVAQVADPNPLGCCQYDVIPGGPSGLQFADETPLPPEAYNGLITADFNGDGYADLVAYSSGVQALEVVYGSPTGLGGGIPSQQWDRDIPGVPGDDLVPVNALPVTIGDLDADGYDDLAFGEANGAVQSNHVTVLYGSAAGLTANGSQDWAKTTPGVPGHRHADDTVGDALAAGDFSNSGADDLVASASPDLLALPGMSGTGLTAAGSRLVKGVTADSFNAGAFGKSAADDLLASTSTKACIVIYGSTSTPTGLKPSRAVNLTLGNHRDCEVVPTQ
jgi:hypothetical protein